MVNRVLHNLYHYPRLSPLFLSAFAPKHPNLVKMNPPQFPLALPFKRRPCVQHPEVVAHQHIAPLPAEIQTHAAVVQHRVHQPDDLLRAVLDSDDAVGELRLPFRPRLVPAYARLVRGRVPHDEGQAAHVIVPEAAVFTGPGEILEGGEGVRRGQVLEEEGGGGEEGVARPLGAGRDARKVLEPRRVADVDFLAGFGIGLLDELEHAVVVHGHRFRGDDVVGHAVGAAGVFDFLLDAEGPGRDGT